MLSVCVPGWPYLKNQERGKLRGILCPSLTAGSSAAPDCSVSLIGVCTSEKGLFLLLFSMLKQKLLNLTFSLTSKFSMLAGKAVTSGV